MMPTVEQLEPKMLEDPELFSLLRVGLIFGIDVAQRMVAFYKGFIFRVADREVDGFILNQAWTQAAIANLETIPAAGVLIRRENGFASLMKAVVPDSQVVIDSVNIRQQYEEELQRLGRAERQEWAHLGDWDM